MSYLSRVSNTSSISHATPPTPLNSTSDQLMTILRLKRHRSSWETSVAIHRHPHNENHNIITPPTSTHALTPAMPILRYPFLYTPDAVTHLPHDVTVSTRQAAGPRSLHPIANAASSPITISDDELEPSKARARGSEGGSEEGVREGGSEGGREGGKAIRSARSRTSDQ
ncbi:hypothetical protein M011DRAFT_348772 [Sporormia fimetaria CBS 119925]|uniref:Uncharacterized protein n=1 Tax=Sporormia fimetaria CBS 119925 TaxID=1340428 RepID=A0A6A6VF60_9PLEO|nr:hypothetical protein M011DRAFT_348772 [Sporormia fimetaria CBS 119925]